MFYISITCVSYNYIERVPLLEAARTSNRYGLMAANLVRPTDATFSGWCLISNLMEVTFKRLPFRSSLLEADYKKRSGST